MNILQGVIQRLTIIEQSTTRLLLRELPVAEWAAAFAVLIVAVLLFLAELTVSAGIALLIVLYFIVAGRLRLVEFDRATGKLMIYYQTLLKRETVNSIPLENIHRSYLFKGDDGGTQIILVRRDGEESGISVYSEDLSPWKEDIVIAINAILYDVKKDARSTSETESDTV